MRAVGEKLIFNEFGPIIYKYVPKSKMSCTDCMYN